MKYLALVFLVSAVYAGSAHAVPNDYVVPMYHPHGPVLVPGPSATKHLGWPWHHWHWPPMVAMPHHHVIYMHR